MKREELLEECEKVIKSIREFSTIYQNPVSVNLYGIEDTKKAIDKCSDNLDKVRNNLNIVLEALSTPSEKLEEYNKAITDLNKSYLNQDFNTFDLINLTDDLFDKLTNDYKQKLNVNETKDKDKINKSENKVEHVDKSEFINKTEEKLLTNEVNENKEAPSSIEILNNKTLKLWICGDTPKSIYGNDLSNKRYISLKKVIEKILLKLIKQGIKEFLVGVNRGFDMLCLEVLCNIKNDYGIKIHIVSPYYSYISKRSEEELKHYDQLVKQSDNLFYIDKIYPKQYNSVNELLKAKNQFLVNYAQYGLTMHIDGIENSVSNAISIAEGKTKTIFSIDKETLKVSKKK